MWRCEYGRLRNQHGATQSSYRAMSMKSATSLIERQSRFYNDLIWSWMSKEPLSPSCIILHPMLTRRKFHYILRSEFRNFQELPLQNKFRLIWSPKILRKNRNFLRNHRRSRNFPFRGGRGISRPDIQFLEKIEKIEGVETIPGVVEASLSTTPKP